MRRKTYPPEEIARKLKQAEVLMASGTSMATAANLIGVKYGTLYQWRRRFADADAEVISHIKRLEAENARLRKAVDELETTVLPFPQRVSNVG